MISVNKGSNINITKLRLFYQFFNITIFKTEALYE